MKNFGQKIIRGFQLHIKGVRIMITISVVLLLGIFFFPTMNKDAVMKPIMQMEEISGRPLMDTTVTMSDCTRTRVLIRRQPANVHMPMAAPPTKSIGDNKSLLDETDTIKSKPIQVQIVQEAKPFDWKGTATWLIGLINGLVLVALNIKNILKKTP